MSTLVAVPSDMPGGLDAPMGMHFGHCDLFTLVETEDNKVTTVTTMPNPPHEEGGCLAPVQLLAGKGVNAIIVGGMGYRPLMAFAQAGIRVLYAKAPTVQACIDAYLAGQLPEFSKDQTCHGGA